MKFLRSSIFCFSLIFVTPAFSERIAGVNEVVTLLPDNIQMEAKFDTGADTSSLDANGIEYFTKDNQDWVRFTIDRNLNGKDYLLEYPIARHVRIVARIPAEGASIKPHHKRPVINMDICIGNQQKTIEINLTDRENFKYPFLLGASALAKFDLLVDAGEKHLLNKECTAKSENTTNITQ